MKDQTQNIQTREKVGAKRWLVNLLWLMIAFVPAVVTLSYLKDIKSMPTKWFWILNGICSLIAGVGFFRNLTTKKLANGVAGLGTGMLIFVLNLSFVAIIVAGLMLINFTVSVYQGCCSGHS